MNSTLILQILQFVQGIAPILGDAWKKLHKDDPAKQSMTDMEAFADLVTTGDFYGDKWKKYIDEHPLVPKV